MLQTTHAQNHGHTIGTRETLAKMYTTKVEEDLVHSPERERILEEFTRKTRFAHLETEPKELTA